MWLPASITKGVKSKALDTQALVEERKIREGKEGTGSRLALEATERALRERSSVTSCHRHPAKQAACSHTCLCLALPQCRGDAAQLVSVAAVRHTAGPRAERPALAIYTRSRSHGPWCRRTAAISASQGLPVLAYWVPASGSAACLAGLPCAGSSPPIVQRPSTCSPSFHRPNTEFKRFSASGKVSWRARKQRRE